MALHTLLATPSRAEALVAPPTTIDGPSSEILDFGGTAIASDGSGGLVYTKAVEGVPHVFAARYDDGHWSAPVRVDWDQPFDASWPRIAAGPSGRLLVVWVTQTATVGGKIQRGLFSASLGPGATSFGPSLLVDPNVGAGVGVDPSLAGVDPGKAIVAYRVVTDDFTTVAFDPNVQLRPGDVMADIRLARLGGDRWSRIGAINRNPAASMRPPSPTNGPQVGIGADGSAVVAWQEPDQSGVARIWTRRIFGTTPGPVLEASPTSWAGTPVSADVDAFSLAVTDHAQARIAMRIAAGSSSSLGGTRILLNTLPPTFSPSANALSGSILFDGAGSSSAAAPGVPSVAASDEGAAGGSLRLAFGAGGGVRQLGVDSSGKPVVLPEPPGPAVGPGGEVLAAVDPSGGGIVAWASRDARGEPALAVRQDFPSGAAQTGLFAGRQAGPISELSLGRADTGEGLLGFRQGEAGHFEIVGEDVSTPPANLAITIPSGWVRPPRARIRWGAPPAGVGPFTYGVLLDGHLAASGLGRRRLTPPPRLLGDGVRRVQVLATDALGHQLLSRPVKLRVDARAPSVSLAGSPRSRGRGGGGPASPRQVTVRLRDPESGVRSASCRFGDGSRPLVATHACRHTYASPGRYEIVVRARDRAGNRTTRRLAVRVP